MNYETVPHDLNCFLAISAQDMYIFQLSLVPSQGGHFHGKVIGMLVVFFGV